VRSGMVARMEALLFTAASMVIAIKRLSTLLSRHRRSGLAGRTPAEPALLEPTLMLPEAVELGWPLHPPADPVS